MCEQLARGSTTWQWGSLIRHYGFYSIPARSTDNTFTVTDSGTGYSNVLPQGTQFGAGITLSESETISNAVKMSTDSNGRLL